MKLEGQAQRQPENQLGYAMAALLVAMSIMAIMMTVVMPVWKHAAQREKETELVFRGLQYVHAIGMFQRKYANAYPPNIDALVEQRFLRKKFKDPITNDDFAIIPVGQGAPGTAQPGAGQRGGGTPTGRGQTAPATTQPGGRGISPFGTPSAGTTAGISGVMSKSKDQSIRLYNGRSHYNEWAFVYTPQIQAPGAGGAPGTPAPGQRGQPGQQQPNPFGGGGIGGQRGRGNPNGPGTGRPGGPGNPNAPGGGRGFGPGPTPMQPIFPPRGRL